MIDKSEYVSKYTLLLEDYIKLNYFYTLAYK